MSVIPLGLSHDLAAASFCVLSHLLWGSSGQGVSYSIRISYRRPLAEDSVQLIYIRTRTEQGVYMRELMPPLMIVWPSPTAHPLLTQYDFTLYFIRGLLSTGDTCFSSPRASNLSFWQSSFD